LNLAVPWYVRGLTSLLLVLFAVVPIIVIIACFILGPVLALAEGWSALAGIEYLLSNALQLAVPLTDVAPDSVGGEIIDLMISIWVMLVVTAAIGLAAQMLLITKLGALVPDSSLGFVRWLVVNIPIVLIAISLVSGAMMALAEGWSFSDGFFYMAGEAAGVGLVVVGPSTAFGALVDAIFTMFQLGLSGAVIGIIAGHPLTGKVIQAIEGKALEQEATEGSGNGGEAKLKAPEDMSEEEVQRQMLVLQDRLSQLQKARNASQSHYGTESTAKTAWVTIQPTPTPCSDPRSS